MVNFFKFFKWRSVRDFTCSIKNDISFCFQNRGEGLDMNVQKAWAMGVTGKGVAVTILDDGIEREHPDLIQNYVS